MTAKQIEPPLPTEAKRRLRTAAHRAAVRFENEESLRLLAKLRELVKAKTGPEGLEAFLAKAEAESC